MHLQITNKTTQTRDVCRFGFESTGALEFDNEYSAGQMVQRHVVKLASSKTPVFMQVVEYVRRGSKYQSGVDDRELASVHDHGRTAHFSVAVNGSGAHSPRPPAVAVPTR